MMIGIGIAIPLAPAPVALSLDFSRLDNSQYVAVLIL